MTTTTPDQPSPRPAGPRQPAGPPSVGRRSAVRRSTWQPDRLDGPRPGRPRWTDQRAATARAARRRRTKDRRRNIILAPPRWSSCCPAWCGRRTYYFEQRDAANQINSAVHHHLLLRRQDAMAKLGDQNDTIIPDDQIPEFMKQAVVAAEDNTSTELRRRLQGHPASAWNKLHRR